MVKLTDKIKESIKWGLTIGGFCASVYGLVWAWPVSCNTRELANNAKQIQTKIRNYSSDNILTTKEMSDLREEVNNFSKSTGLADYFAYFEKKGNLKLEDVNSAKRFCMPDRRYITNQEAQQLNKNFGDVAQNFVSLRFKQKAASFLYYIVAEDIL